MDRSHAQFRTKCRTEIGNARGIWCAELVEPLSHQRKWLGAHRSRVWTSRDLFLLLTIFSRPRNIGEEGVRSSCAFGECIREYADGFIVRTLFYGVQNYQWTMKDLRYQKPETRYGGETFVSSRLIDCLQQFTTQRVARLDSKPIAPFSNSICVAKGEESSPRQKFSGE